jgi:hypothetical protein
MRETRPSGSEGGARSIPCPYPICNGIQSDAIHVGRDEFFFSSRKAIGEESAASDSEPTIA